MMKKAFKWQLLGVGLSLFLVLFIMIPRLSFAAEKELVICAAGGAFADAVKKCFISPFEKETGIKVTFVSPWNFAKLKAMVDSKNVEWDIMENPPETRHRALKEGLLEQLDYSKIPRSKGCIPEGIQPYWMGLVYYATNYCYNTKAYSKEHHPRTSVDFWDIKKFPGRRSIRNTPVGNLEIALLADGVPRDKIYPIDVDRAFKKLDEIKPHIAVWWKEGAQPAQLLTDKEVDLATVMNGRAFAVYSQGGPIGLEWGDGFLQMSAWSIPKGAKNKENAHKFLNFFLKGDLWEPFLRIMPYPGPAKDIYKYIPADLAKEMPTYPENYKKMVYVNDEWWANNIEKMRERWDKWMLK